MIKHDRQADIKIKNFNIVVWMNTRQLTCKQRHTRLNRVNNKCEAVKNN